MLRALAHVDPDAVWWLLTQAEEGQQVAANGVPLKETTVIAGVLRDVDGIAVPWHADVG